MTLRMKQASSDNEQIKSTLNLLNMQGDLTDVE